MSPGRQVHAILDQNERTWRNRFPPTSGAGGRVVERYGDFDDSNSADRETVAPDGETDLRSCSVCEFASAEYEDVYGHLITAHRKSTISEMLLEQ